MLPNYDKGLVWLQGYGVQTLKPRQVKVSRVLGLRALGVNYGLGSRASWLSV